MGSLTVPLPTFWYLQEYRHILEEIQGVRAQDLLQIQEEDERVEDMVNNMSTGPERLQQLHHQYTQVSVQLISESC